MWGGGGVWGGFMAFLVYNSYYEINCLNQKALKNPGRSSVSMVSSSTTKATVATMPGVTMLIMTLSEL